MAGRANTRRTVYIHAHVARLSRQRLAGVQAHPHLDLHSLGPVVFGHSQLGFDHSLNGLGRSGEGDEKGVALGVHFPAVTLGEYRPEYSLLVGQELLEMDLAEGDIPGGLMLVADQLMLGFDQDRLVYAESFYLAPEIQQ